MNFSMFLLGLDDVQVIKMEKIADRIAFHVDEAYTSLSPACQAITT